MMLGAKPDVVNREFRDVAAWREASWTDCPGFCAGHWLVRAFWILVDFVLEVNRVSPELQSPEHFAGFD